MTQETKLTRRNTSVITQSQAMYLLRTIWKDAPEAEVIKAAILCRQYNLNPLMRQVYLVQFGKEWVTILGIKATRQIAQQALSKRGIRYSYQDGPRVMSEKEQVKIRGKVESDKIWAVTIIQDSFGNTFPGYGWWPANKQPYGSDKGNDAFNMAFIRSERNALDKLAPGELPDIDTGDESYIVGDFMAALNEGKQQIIADADQDVNELWGDGKPEATTSTPSEGIKEKSGIISQVVVQQVLRDANNLVANATDGKKAIAELQAMLVLLGAKGTTLNMAIKSLDAEGLETFARNIAQSEADKEEKNSERRKNIDRDNGLD